MVNDTPWTTIDDQTVEPVVSPKEPEARVYLPILETLRLYAGWLLAWYCLVYAVGSYQFLKETPFRIPYAESLFLSPLVISFTLSAFLFLLFTSLHKAVGGGKLKGLLFLALGIAAFILYRMNIV